MRFGVLGPFEARADAPTDGPVALGGRKQRALLALLVAARGRVVSTDRLVDELWGEAPPAKAMVSLQSYVANLRRALEPARTARSTPQILLTRAPGYAIDLDRHQVDAAEFEQLVGRARSAGGLQTAYDTWRRAERLWRGPAYADLVDLAPGLAAEATRLGEVRLTAVEARLRAALELGQHEPAVAELEVLVAAQPIRESLWALLALALYRSNRQADAVAAIARARQQLTGELGLDLGAELRRLESDLLRQHPRLAAPPRATAPRTGGPPVRMVGRLPERDTVRVALDQARSGRGRLVLVSGEPGIGKTELARAGVADARERGWPVGWGRASESGDLPGLLPLGLALTDLLGGGAPERSADLRTRYGERLGALLPGPSPAPAVDVDTATFRLTQTLSALVAELGPTLLVLDDAHWADEPALGLLRAWLPQLARLPVVVLLTLRSAEADITAPLAGLLAEAARSDPVRIRLTGLDLPTTALLLQARRPAAVDRAPSAELIEALHVRSGGNPFFLSELVALLADTGDADLTAVPDGVRDVVRRRLGQLPAPVTALVQTAALMGDRFEPELLESASGLPDPLTACEVALAAGLIRVVEPDQWGFAHALVRDAVVEQLSSGARRLVHRRIAAALEAHDPDRHTAELARHYGAAGREFSRTTTAYALRGAEAASRRGDADVAGQLYGLAATASARDPRATAADRHRILVRLAAAHKRTGHDQQAGQVSLAAAELALAGGDVVGAADAAIAMSASSLWSWREYQTVDRDAVALLERLLQRLPDGEPRREALLRSTWAAEVFYDPGSGPEAVRQSDRALSLITEHGTPDDLARVLELRHLSFERPALLPERLATAEQLVRLADARGDEMALATALIFRGRDRIESGAAVAGVADYERARALATRLSYAPALVALAWWDVSVRVGAGQFTEAERAFDLALRLHQRTTLPGADGTPMLVRGVLGMANGSLAQEVDFFEQAWRQSRLSLVRDFLALALVADGRRDEARPLVEASIQDPPPPDYLWLTHQAVRAELWTAAAGPEALRDLARQLEPYAGRIVIAGTGISLLGAVDGWLARIHRRLGDPAQADRCADLAADVNATLGVTAF